MKRWLPFFCTLLLTTTAMSCPFCKDSVPGSDAQAAGSLPNGFNDSVYFMLGGFFVVLGLVSTIVFKGVRSSNPTARGPGFPLQ